MFPASLYSNYFITVDHIYIQGALFNEQALWIVMGFQSCSQMYASVISHLYDVVFSNATVLNNLGLGLGLGSTYASAFELSWPSTS